MCLKVLLLISDVLVGQRFNLVKLEAVMPGQWNDIDLMQAGGPSVRCFCILQTWKLGCFSSLRPSLLFRVLPEASSARVYILPSVHSRNSFDSPMKLLSLTFQRAYISFIPPLTYSVTFDICKQKPERKRMPFFSLFSCHRFYPGDLMRKEKERKK